MLLHGWISPQVDYSTFSQGWQLWILALTAQADPVLAELWDNEKDAAYDYL